MRIEHEKKETLKNVPLKNYSHFIKVVELKKLLDLDLDNALIRLIPDETTTTIESYKTFISNAIADALPKELNKLLIIDKDKLADIAPRFAKVEPEIKTKDNDGVIKTMYFCRSCWKQVSYGSRFCRFCGQALDWELLLRHRFIPFEEIDVDEDEDDDLLTPTDDLDYEEDVNDGDEEFDDEEFEDDEDEEYDDTASDD